MSVGVTMPGQVAQWAGGVFQEAITVPGQLALSDLFTEMNENHTKMSKFNIMHSQLNYAFAQHRKCPQPSQYQLM